MTFDIREYTSKLENLNDNESYLVADCPVCKQHKLKINATTGAYGCYGNRCIAKDIRNAIAKYTPYIPTNQRKVQKQTRLFLDAEPIEIPYQILSSIGKHFVRCDRKEEVDRKYYQYTLWQQTIRFYNKEGKKIVAPQFLKNDNYVSGTGFLPWILFNEDFLFEYPVETNTETYREDVKGKYICMAEGEPCAVYVTQDSYECLTPAGFCWTPEFLDNSARRLKEAGIKGCLYFADNDSVGEKKAKLVANAFWRNSLECSVINPAFCISDAPSGYDIKDSNFEIQDIVNMWIQR